MEKYKYLVVCDYREKFETIDDELQFTYNDHYKKENIDNIIRTINELGYECSYFGGVQELLHACYNNSKYENNIFLNLNDGLTQLHKRGQTPILLEIITDKYSGSNAFTSLLVNNKYCTNQLLKSKNIVNTPKSFLFFSNYNNNFQFDDIKFSVIIKPNCEGSSIGINQNSICNNINELNTQIQILRESYKEILIEEYIEGYEITVFILGNKKILFNQPLMISINDETYFKSLVIDYKMKAKHKRKFINPNNELDSNILNNLKEISEKIFHSLNMQDYGRFDFRIRNNEIYFIEANTVPAIGLSSDVGAICNINNIDFKDFINILIQTINNRLIMC